MLGSWLQALRRPRPEGLDFTLHMRRLCAAIVERLPEFSHVDLQAVAIRVCQTRRHGRHGVHATLTPLRFAGGQRTTIRRGRTYSIEPVFDESGREFLYLLSFYLPRFCDQPFEEKLATVFHELWHISPDFDGDLRRLPGRCYAHGHSQQQFHADMARFVDAWRAQDPPEGVQAFLRHDFLGLSRRFGPVRGTRIRTPRLVSQAIQA